MKAARRTFAGVICALTLCGAAAIADDLIPRPEIIKPPVTVLEPWHRDDIITVKFNDELYIRANGGMLDDMGTGALDEAQPLLAALAGGFWEPAHETDPLLIDAWREAAHRNLGRVVADLNLQFNFTLPVGMPADLVINDLNALECVELAQPIAWPVEQPTPPNYQANQGYLNTSPTGVDTAGMWGILGGTGANVAICDIEYSWNFNHDDLPSLILLGGAPNDPFGNNNHGTAVAGQLGGLLNGWGVTGGSYNSWLYVSPANLGPGSGVWDVGKAITNAMASMSAGDVILIEQQYPGPNYTGIPAGTQVGLVPVEWNLPWYNAITLAVGNGFIVVEAGCNGSQDLDSSAYNTGGIGHYPFTAANDSGAIIVGAGAAPAAFGGSDTARSRLWYSNFGSTVDLQGWGEAIYTTGYGTLYSAEGVNRWYTASFSGTSGASPIVAAACATLSSTYEAAAGGLPLPPATCKAYLQSTGAAQQSGTYPSSQNIGPLPNTTAAWSALYAANDCNNNGAFDNFDVQSGTSCDVNFDGIPDECQGIAWTGGNRAYVDPTAPGAQTGVNWPNAFHDLATALAYAHCFPQINEIWVAGGGYLPRAGFYETDPRAATFKLKNNLQVIGGFVGGETSINQRVLGAAPTDLIGDLNGDDGPFPFFPNNSDNAYHIVTASGVDGTAVLDGFNIVAGNSNGIGGAPYYATMGGGLFAFNGSPAIFNCDFAFNHAIDGGGAGFLLHCSPTFDNCKFVANQAQGDGGGIWMDSGGTPNIVLCDFTGNSASIYGGGGWFSDGVVPIVIETEFNSNTAVAGGGGVAIVGDDGVSPVFDLCTFVTNAATTGDGGAMICFAQSRPQVINSGMFGNTAANNGGAVGFMVTPSSNGSAPTFTNTVFSGNAATVSGGAFWIPEQVYPTITNCTFGQNSAPQGTSIACDNFGAGGFTQVTNSLLWSGGMEVWMANPTGPELAIDYSDVQGGWPGTGVGNISLNPVFVDPLGPDLLIGTPDDNLRIMLGSPAADAGDNDADTDQWSPGVQVLPPVDRDLRARRTDSPLVPDTGNAGSVGSPVVDMGAYETRAGDLDGDGDVDAADMQQLLMCLTGPGMPPGCPGVDLDGDGDCDLADLAILQQNYTG